MRGAFRVRRFFTISFVLCFLSLQVTGQALGGSEERTAPYDFGVPGGTLAGISTPCVGLTYSLIPLPYLNCQMTTSGRTGVFIDVSQRSTLTISATIENISAFDPPKRMHACFGFRPVDGAIFPAHPVITSSVDYGPFGCGLVPLVGTRSSITTSLEGSAWEEGLSPGRYAVSVFLVDPEYPKALVGGPSLISVKSITLHQVAT